MKIWEIVVPDRATLAPEPFAFDFPAEVVEYPSTRPEETAARIAGTDVIVTNKVVITAEHITANPQLRLIAVAATGVDDVDIATAKAAGVIVCNIRTYGNESVAERAFMLMIALMRNLPAYQRDIAASVREQSSSFCHFDAPIRDLHDKTPTVLGHGNIGKTLAGYACIFGMNMVFDEHKHAGDVREGYASFDEAIQTAGAVSLHYLLTPRTANTIGGTGLQRMKPGAVLINCGRGGLVDEQALITTLKYGRIGGTSFDALTEEPPRSGNPLLRARLPNLIVTPHMAWGSEEARNRLFATLLGNINRFAVGRPQNVVV